MANKVPPTPIIARPPLNADVQELPTFGHALVSSVTQTFFEHAERLNATLPADGSEPMEGVLSLVAGTEALPGLVFNGDPDTGMWWPGANTLAFSVGGNEAARFASDLTLELQNGLNFGDNDLTEYVEGEWTPVLRTTGTDFDSVTYDSATEGTYTRIGRVVTVSFRLITDAVTVGTPTGAVVVGNVPFAPRTRSAGAAYAKAWAGEHPRIIRLDDPSETFFRLIYRSAITGADTATAIADVATGANSNQLVGSMTYEIA